MAKFLFHKEMGMMVIPEKFQVVVVLVARAILIFQRIGKLLHMEMVAKAEMALLILDSIIKEDSNGVLYS